MTNRPTHWTPEMHQRLRDLWPHFTHKEVARLMGLTLSVVIRRATKLGLVTHSKRPLMEPSKAQWIAAASEEAKAAKIKTSYLLAGDRRRRVRTARWRAFKQILDANPQYSINGLARVSGFDHTTILYGLRRLDGVSAAALRLDASKASGRRPADVVSGEA